MRDESKLAMGGEEFIETLPPDLRAGARPLVFFDKESLTDSYLHLFDEAIPRIGPSRPDQRGPRGLNRFACGSSQAARRPFVLRGTGSLLTRCWREPDSNLYGAFPVKWLFSVYCRFFVRSGKAVLHPVACDQVPGARGRGQGTETLA